MSINQRRLCLFLVAQPKQMKAKSQEAQGKSWTRIQERLGQKLQFSCSVEFGLSNIIVLRTIVFIIFGTEKPWAQTLVI